MQELRFVSVEDGWVIATSQGGDRFRIRIDDTLAAALRPRPQVRSAGPKVPPREIQQLIRAGRTVDEVIQATGADRETVLRFEGPIVAERHYIVDQARAVPVRVQRSDPLSNDAATFGAVIDERLEQLEARQVRWDAWRDLETGWHVGIDFVTGDVERHALWKFDAKAHSLRPDSPAAITLSQQGEPEGLQGPHLRAVRVEHADGVIPVDSDDEPEPEPDPASVSSTANETADLLEQLRRRRGERQHSVYDEMAEYQDDDELVIESSPHTAKCDATVSPFASPRFAPEPDAPASGSAQTQQAEEAEHDPVISGDEPNQLDLEVEPGDALPQVRKRSGRPAMPTWDEIVFGTRTDD